MSIEFFNESGFDGVNEEMLIDVASFALGAMVSALMWSGP